mgnify:CR=1 FL=1
MSQAQSPSAYLVLSSNLLRITGLKNAATKAFISAGVTLTAELRLPGSATPVANGTITLSYVAGTNGEWQGTFSRDAAVTPQQSYEVVITADGGEFLTRHWTLPVIAKAA